MNSSELYVKVEPDLEPLDTEIEEEDLELWKRVKRTRNIKTSQEQFEVYLNAIQGDALLRENSNIKFSTPAFDKKWKYLTNVLNRCHAGPKFSSEEWKKRFSDWKRTATSKNRRIRCGRLKKTLSQNEQRALFLWSSVEDTICSKTGSDENIGAEEFQQKLDTTTSDIKSFPELDEDSFVDKEIHNLQPLPYSEDTQVNNIQEFIKRNNSTQTNKLIFTEHKETQTNAENKEGDEVWISSTGFRNEEQHMKELVKLKRQKLEFKIAKFKFQNPMFSFDLERSTISTSTIRNDLVSYSYFNIEKQ